MHLYLRLILDRLSPPLRDRGALLSSPIASRADRSVQLEDERLWGLALSKWVSIFSMLEAPGPVGMQASRAMSQEGPAARDEVIRDVLGLKSPQTAVKRANALLRVFRWHLNQGNGLALALVAGLLGSILQGSRGHGVSRQCYSRTVRSFKVWVPCDGYSV